MSLDVTLYGKTETTEEICDHCGSKYVRENKEEFFWRNITHNLSNMASEAGDIYYALWRPEEKGWTTASDLIEPIEMGICELQKNPDKYKKMNPANGWGSYEGLLSFAHDYLAACRANPDAYINVCR